MRALLCAVLILCLSGICLAEPPINGTVKDSKGPMEGVSVTLQTRSHGTRAVQTDANGVYRFAGLDRGDYLLIFERDGYETFTHVVSLTFDEDSGEVNVTMVRAKKPAK